MSTDQPQPPPATARARGERAGGQTQHAMVRRWVAMTVAVATLIVGGLLGYLARGGPDAPTQLQVVTDLPIVTITAPATKP